MRTLRSPRTGLLLGALVLTLSATTYAQSYPTCERQPTADDVDGAKGAHKAAQRFYDKGQYVEAIRSWTDAYTFDCTAHPLLINIGNAYEKMGDRPKAVVAFETYLARMGDKADSTIPDKVQNLKAQLERDRTPPPPPAATGTAAPATPPPATPPGDETSSASAGPGAGPWIVVGAGGAVTIIGIVLLGVGNGRMSRAEDACLGVRDPCGGREADGSLVLSQAESEAAAADGTSGRTMVGVGIGGTVLGVLGIGGGLLWYFLDSSEGQAADTTARWSIQPALGPQVQGLTVGASF